MAVSRFETAAEYAGRLPKMVKTPLENEMRRGAEI
jgi:hypothetical protein